MQSIKPLQQQQFDRTEEVAAYIQYCCINGNMPALSIAELSKRFCMSKTVLKIVFKQKFKTSIHAFVIKERIKHICTLLKETPYSIKEIALKCGYEELSNFSRDFAKVVGVSPKAYRMGIMEPDLQMKHQRSYNTEFNAFFKVQDKAQYRLN